MVTQRSESGFGRSLTGVFGDEASVERAPEANQVNGPSPATSPATDR